VVSKVALEQFFSEYISSLFESVSINPTYWIPFIRVNQQPTVLLNKMLFFPVMMEYNQSLFILYHWLQFPA
jgi:hypothetical protein